MCARVSVIIVRVVVHAATNIVGERRGLEGRRSRSSKFHLLVALGGY